jgi:hypothetical protein
MLADRCSDAAALLALVAPSLLLATSEKHEPPGGSIRAILLPCKVV